MTKPSEDKHYGKAVTAWNKKAARQEPEPQATARPRDDRDDEDGMRMRAPIIPNPNRKKPPSPKRGRDFKGEFKG